MTFSFATWNILANSYINPAWYPRTPTHVFEPRWRMPALVRHAASLGVDLLCLQEVEADVFAAFQEGLSAQGYSGMFEKKKGTRPDGCAAFFRTDRFTILHQDCLAYTDGSNHIAQMLRFRHTDRELAIANTHLKWHPYGTPLESQVGNVQVLEILQALAPADARIICGDLNASPDSDVVSTLRTADFDYTHRLSPETHTCNSNAEAKLIDHIFYNGALSMEPLPTPRIDAETPLPSPEHPSDHLPLIARFTWR
ncbi:MAG: endonuclease/exonuclease/phosphatase family protein [Bryobacteraceae bacterium]